MYGWQRWQQRWFGDRMLGDRSGDKVNEKADTIGRRLVVIQINVWYIIYIIRLEISILEIGYGDKGKGIYDWQHWQHI